MRFTLRTLTTFMIASAAVGVLSPSATAQVVWDGVDGASWTVGSNWVGNNAPTANDVALIDNGTMPEVKNATTGLCKLLIVNNDNSTGDPSRVTVVAGGTLIIGDGSAQDSRLDEEDNVLQIAGTVKINGEQTFEGAGVIRLTNDGTASIIALTDDEDGLILETECEEPPIERSCSVTLAGQGEVAVRLDNRAFVVADNGSYPDGLRMTTFQKTTDEAADGFWIAENGAILWIETLVTGPGEWNVIDVDCSDACDAGIIVKAGTDGCVVGTGKVILRDGLQSFKHALKVQENVFATTGRLVWESVPRVDNGNLWTHPRIVVEAATAAMFGLSEAPDPANVCGGS